MLPDGTYDVFVVDAAVDATSDAPALHLEVTILAGDHKGEVVSVRAEGLGVDELEALGTARDPHRDGRGTVPRPGALERRSSQKGSATTTEVAMQRLTGLDASFLSLETPSSHMHVAGLMILDPVRRRRAAIDLDRVKEVYGQRLHLAPPFRRRLAEVPFGLHHPLWIEDPDFDLDFHIRSTALPSPGHARAAVDARRAACRRSRSTAPARCGRCG